jgi:hypothetical protein
MVQTQKPVGHTMYDQFPGSIMSNKRQCLFVLMALQMYEIRMSSLPSWHYFLEETELGTEKLPKQV